MRALDVPDYILPSPSVIVVKIVVSWQLLLVNAFVTLQEILLGFGLSVVIAIPLAIAGGLFAHLRARRVSVHGLAADHSEGRAGADPGDVARLRHHAQGDGGLSDLVLPDRDQFRDRHALGREGDDLSGAVHGRERAHDLPQDPAAEGAALDLRRAQGRDRPGGGGRDGRRVHRRRAGLGYLQLISQVRLDTPLLFAAVVVLSLLGVLLFNAVAFVERIALPWNRVATDVAE